MHTIGKPVFKLGNPPGGPIKPLLPGSGLLFTAASSIFGIFDGLGQTRFGLHGGVQRVAGSLGGAACGGFGGAQRGIITQRGNFRLTCAQAASQIIQCLV